MIGKIDVDKKNVDIRLTRKGTLDVSEVQDGKRKKNKQKRRERNEKSERISESSGKAKEREKENDKIQEWVRSSKDSTDYGRM